MYHATEIFEKNLSAVLWTPSGSFPKPFTKRGTRGGWGCLHGCSRERDHRADPLEAEFEEISSWCFYCPFYAAHQLVQGLPPHLPRGWAKPGQLPLWNVRVWRMAGQSQVSRSCFSISASVCAQVTMALNLNFTPEPLKVRGVLMCFLEV